MKLNSGDFIRYERQPTTTSYLISSIQVENESENVNTAWSAFDRVVLSPASNTTSIFWPTENLPFGSNDPQYPSTQFADITAINAWRITRLEDGVSQTLLNQFVVTFAPPTTGTYSIAVTATKAGGQRIFESTNIPKITAVSQFTNEEILLDFTTPTNGFLIEQDLFGWNYNTNRPQTNAPGAKPYWAELYFDKSPTTKFKGVYTWGYPNKYIDNYLPNSNPILSPLEISYGSVVDYNRKNYTFEWNQPLKYKTFIGRSQWSQLSSSTTNFSNLSSLYSSKRQEELTVNYNTNPTNIELTNTKNGRPVEILYHALNSFVWTVSVETTPEIESPTPELFFSAPKPWANLSNRFFPTIASIPVLEEIYTKDDVGGYFIPQNLGASQFINKSFDTFLKTVNLSGEFLTEDQNVHIGGRGLTKQNQDSLYSWEEKNQWLKESPVTGQLAGAVRKDLTKSLQTFVPYQTNSDQTFLGLVTPSSRVSPWGGPFADQWTDLKNEPKSFTGVRNVSAWAESQILKQNEKTIDCWTTDVFGNQYGLFKDLSGVKVSERPNVGGQLWTRTNNQMVNPAYKSLSAIFGLFQSNSNIYNQLIGEGIKSVDCFFDTLMIEISSSVIFIQLDYNYEEAKISAVFDNIVVEPLNANRRFEQTWFMPESKKLITLFTGISSSNFYPELTEFDLSTKIYSQKFPTTITTSADLLNSLADVQFKTLSKAAIHYNRTKQMYLLTYQGTDVNDKFFVVDFEIEQREIAVLNKINKYIDTTSSTDILEPPVAFNQFLNVINTGLNFSVQVSATNTPTSYTIVNPISGITVNNSGLFVGSLSAQGLYHINYNVSNNIGTNTFCLTINAT
jgi:hypothetical protein